MNGWLLDTNVVGSLMATNGAPSVTAWASAIEERRFFLSLLTIAEYDKGIAQLAAGDPRHARYALERDALIARFHGRILSVSDAVVRRWGEMAGRIRRDMGHPPHVVDTMLCATAIEAGLYFATRNVRDARRSGAVIFNPWTDDPAAFPVA